MMGFTLGYALQNPATIPIANETDDQLAIDYIPQPPKKKKKTNTVTEKPPEPQQNAVALIERNDEREENPPIQQPNEIVQVPEEYDFDLLSLLQDVQNTEMVLPDEPNLLLLKISN